MKIRLRNAARREPCQSVVIRQKRRTAKLDAALYMRPIRPSRMGHVNTEWSEDGWYRHGVPVGKSLILVLKCGHIQTVPQHPMKLRKLVYCPMCVRLWTERMQEDLESRQRQKKRERVRQQQHIEVEDIMAKKTMKKSAKADDRRGRKTFEFVKAAKDMVDETIMGVVYNAIKKLKSGTVSEIAEAALKGGLKDYTGQDPLVQTGVMLNRLKGMGNVKKVQAEKAPKAAKGKVVLKLKKKKVAA